MTPVRATDERLIDAPADVVWRVLADVAAYPTWWPASLGVSVAGADITIAPRGGRAFTCRITGVHPPTRIDMEYPGPFIRGAGQWRLAAEGDRTRVTYCIDATANGWLARILGAVVNFGAVHSRQMEEVFDALSRACAARQLTGEADQCRDRSGVSRNSKNAGNALG